MGSANCRRPDSKTVTRILSLHCGRPLRHRANPFRGRLRLPAQVSSLLDRPPPRDRDPEIARPRPPCRSPRYAPARTSRSGVRGADYVPGRRRSTANLKEPRELPPLQEAATKDRSRSRPDETGAIGIHRIPPSGASSCGCGVCALPHVRAVGLLRPRRSINYS